MRKLFKLLAFMMPFFAVSCVDSLVEPEVDHNVKGDKVTITLHSSAATKTVLVDDVHVRWEEGDIIYINDELYPVRLDENNPELAYVDDVVPADSYTAYYAASWYKRQPDGLALYLESFQDYRKGSFDQFANVMVAQGTTTDLYFYNAASVLKLGVTGDVVVKELAVSGNNGEVMSGLFLVSNETLEALDKDYEGVKADTLYWKHNFVSLRMDEGLQLSGTPEYLYVVVPPQTYENGFTVTIVDGEGRVGVQSTNKSITTTRSGITKMADFNFTAAEAVVVDVTPGQADVTYNVKAPANATVASLVVLKEVWDFYEGFESDQLKGLAFLQSYADYTALTKGEATNTVNTFVNLNGNIPYIAAANDYVLLSAYSGGNYAMGNVMITEFTTLEATGEVPTLDVTYSVDGSSFSPTISVSDDVVCIQLLLASKEWLGATFTKQYSFEDLVNMLGMPNEGDVVEMAKSEEGLMDKFTGMNYDEENVYVVRAVTATGASKTVAVEFRTGKGTWGLVGDVTNWGNPDAEGNVIEDIVLEALSDSSSVYVARNVELPDGGFKFRKDNIWNDNANVGLDGNYYVSVDKEYSWVNGSASGNIYVAAGTYDIYLDEFNRKFYVMTPGKSYTEAFTPFMATWYIVGSFNDWTCGDESCMMTREYYYHVIRGVEFPEGTELKFNIGSWEENLGGTFTEVNEPVYVYSGGENIVVPPGVYDIYLNAIELGEVYFMTPGYVPGEKPEEPVALYYNDFDRETATKSFGTNGTSWPYLDQFDGWMNQIGTGADNVTYSFAGVSARANSASDGSYSDYKGSGFNNMFFGADAYLATKDIALAGNRNLMLSFGTEKYSQDSGSIFTPSEFHIYLSNDGVKWVELTDYIFLGGTTEGRWNTAVAYLSVPAGTETLSICMKTDVSSAYRMDDLLLTGADVEGTAIDFSNAVEMDFGAKDETEESVEPVAATVAEFLAAAEGIQPYILTGTISNLVNTTYGNFNLVDETGYVYVYGLTATKVEKNDKSFASLGLKEGDTVTLIGTRASYNGNPQVGGPAYYVSHVAGEEPEEPETPADSSAVSVSVTMIDNVESLSAGTYYMAGYLASYTSSGTTYDWSAYPYHLCSGTGADLVTTNYSCEGGALVKGVADAADAVDVVLEAVADKANVYYVKIGAGYLYSTSYANRKLAIGDTPVEWSATNNANGGITLTTTMTEGTISLGTAGAVSKIIRSYKAESTLKYGLVFFAKN